jgi:gluconokinase
MSVKLKPRVLVVMGVSGSGKTSVAQGLHDVLGWPYQEGDQLHSKENVAKMSAGIPLTDEDRWPWLDTCAAWIHARVVAGEGGLLTCSALKRAYRERLRQGNPGVLFLFLKTSEEVLRARLEQRRGHYMPPSLLPSQLRTLEEPTSDEPALIVPVERTVEQTVADVREALKRLDESGA